MLPGQTKKKEKISNAVASYSFGQQIFFSVKEKNDFMANRRLKGLAVLPHEKERLMGMRYEERNSFNPGEPF